MRHLPLLLVGLGIGDGGAVGDGAEPVLDAGTEDHHRAPDDDEVLVVDGLHQVGEGAAKVVGSDPIRRILLEGVRRLHVHAVAGVDDLLPVIDEVEHGRRPPVALIKK